MNAYDIVVIGTGTAAAGGGEARAARRPFGSSDRSPPVGGTCEAQHRLVTSDKKSALLESGHLRWIEISAIRPQPEQHDNDAKGEWHYIELGRFTKCSGAGERRGRRQLRR